MWRERRVLREVRPRVVLQLHILMDSAAQICGIGARLQRVPRGGHAVPAADSSALRVLSVSAMLPAYDSQRFATCILHLTLAFVFSSTPTAPHSNLAPSMPATS